MYKRHSNWDEDKLDIHSTSGTGGASGYALHSHHEHGGHAQDYHAAKDYMSRDSEDGANNYMSMKRHDEGKKKDDEGQEKTIVDAVKQEEKYIKKNQEEKEGKGERFHTATWDTRNNSDSGSKGTDSETIKDKDSRSIEDAISEATKKKNETVHVD